MRIEVVTLFPALIADALRFGVLARALDRGLLSVGTEDPRAHALDTHRTVDDRPYGGGPGMVLKPEPLCAAIEAARRRAITAWEIVDDAVSARPYLGGNSLSLAEIVMATHIYRWFNYAIERPAMPHLKAWYDRFRDRPGFKAHIIMPIT